MLTVVKKTSAPISSPSDSEDSDLPPPQSGAAHFLLYPHHNIRYQAQSEHEHTYKHLLQLLRAIPIDFEEKKRTDQLSPTSKHIISVGGDGTLLEVASQIPHSQTLLIGIRSSSFSVGHLCTVTEKHLPDLITAYLNSTIPTVRAHRIRAHILPEISLLSSSAPHTALTSRITSIALNDILYVNARPGAATRYILGGKNRTPARQISSGIWFYTGTGSTAAVKACGAQPIPQDSPRIGFMVREPYSHFCASSPPHTHTLLHGHFSATSHPTYSWQDLSHAPIALKNLTQQAYLVIDGRDTFAVNKGDVVVIESAPFLQLAQKLPLTISPSSSSSHAPKKPPHP